MRLFNTLTNRLETFTPGGQPVTMYVCGITPYDTTHLGHAFTYVAADILIRYLEATGNRVRYVQNVTDIDDDILRKAGETGEEWRQLGNHWTTHYIEDMQSLNVRPPDEFPRATDVIPDIIKSVQNLLDQGVAYHAGGSVYYDVNAWDDYGKLSKLKPEQMLPVANQRGNKPDDPNKKDPLDFVLWQAQAPGEPAWDSPWGRGRPGWHIECSTMSTCLLAETLDLHLGGADLIFPHHESEIAQVEPANGNMPFVRYWMHIAMVYHEREKMSKSLGNLVMVRDLLETYTADTLRLYLASHHYRDAWSYNQDELEQISQLSDELVVAVTAASGEGGFFDASPQRDAFFEAMENDLDTVTALQAVNELTGEIMKAAMMAKDITLGQETLRELARILGLRLDADTPEPEVISGWTKHLERFTVE